MASTSPASTASRDLDENGEWVVGDLSRLGAVDCT